jgi:CheY-like chemotaxis protein
MKALSILVVEDHALSRQLVCDLLRHRGHDVDEAVDVDAARASLARRRPTLVLTDLAIPGGGGEAVLAATRHLYPQVFIPVALVTASAMRGDRERLLRLGFDAYFDKPIDVGAFGAAVEALGGRVDT